MRIFLDVGAHLGETVRAVVDPVYRLDRIVCFEPVKDCCEQLKRIGDRRVVVLPFGLWKETCERPVFGAGGLAGSIFPDMKSHNGSTLEMCRFVKASDWFRENVEAEDTVFLKLNCEGSECDIIDDLLDSAEFEKVDFMMIDFDVRKIPSQKYRRREVKSRLRKYPFPRVSFCKDVMVGPTHEARIRNWLHVVGADGSAISFSRRLSWKPLVEFFARPIPAQSAARKLSRSATKPAPSKHRCRI